MFEYVAAGFLLLFVWASGAIVAFFIVLEDFPRTDDEKLCATLDIVLWPLALPRAAWFILKWAGGALALAVRWFCRWVRKELNP